MAQINDKIIIKHEAIHDLFISVGPDSSEAQEIPNIIRTSSDLSFFSCKYLRGKAHHHIGELVGIKDAQVEDLHPLPFGYTQFSVTDPDYFDCAIKHGDPIENVIVHRPRGSFFGIIRDDIFNYPYLFITEYEPPEDAS